MSNTADAPAAQVPEIGSEEWVAQKLAATGMQADDAEASEQYEESQADDAQATTTAAEPDAPAAAPSWREAAIPVNDETVPQHFRGKPVATVYDSYRELERAFNDDRKRMRELEAKVAAQETFKEFLAQQQAATKQPTTLADPYAAAGIDLDTDPVLNPRKFAQVQEEIVTAKARELLAEELRKRDEAAAQAALAKQEEMAIAAALSRVERERGLNEQQMRARIPSMMMSVAEQFGREALRDPDKVLAAHDAIFGAPAPTPVVPATQPVPNPPGVKRPVAVEPSTRSGPQLKSYEREIVAQMREGLQNALPNIPIDEERLMAAFAVQLKKARS